MIDMGIINGVRVEVDRSLGDMTVKEVEGYIDDMFLEKDERLTHLIITPAKEKGNIRLECVADRTKFDRIRRITGYLVGTKDRWNSAKRDEEADRVKHQM